jgi:hypothetical protein
MARFLAAVARMAMIAVVLVAGVFGGAQSAAAAPQESASVQARFQLKFADLYVSNMQWGNDHYGNYIDVTVKNRGSLSVKGNIFIVIKVNGREYNKRQLDFPAKTSLTYRFRPTPLQDGRPCGSKGSVRIIVPPSAIELKSNNTAVIPCPWA